MMRPAAAGQRSKSSWIWSYPSLVRGRRACRAEAEGVVVAEAVGFLMNDGAGSWGASA